MNIQRAYIARSINVKALLIYIATEISFSFANIICALLLA